MKKFLSIFTSLLMLVGCSSTTTSTSSMESTSAPVEDITTVRIAAMKGPTAMGLVSLFDKVDQNELENYTYTIEASADSVTALLAKNEIDVATVPANVASVLYNNNQDIQVLAINTLGVLYIVDANDSVSSVQDLKGKTIYASGKGTTPEYALNYILQQNGLDIENDLTIEWLSEQNEVVAKLSEDKNALALLPQPFVVSAQSKIEGLDIALDLTEEWDKLQQDAATPSSLITGVVIAPKSFIEQHPDRIEQFLTDYSNSVDTVINDFESASSLIGNYGIVDQAIALKALPYCNIVFIRGNEMKDKLQGYLQVLYDANAKSVGNALPNDDFYYEG